MANTSLNNVLRVIALIVLLGVVVYAYLINLSPDSNDLKEKISTFTLADLSLPIALSLLSYLLRFIRWRLILKQLGYRLPIKNDLIYYLSGFALTMTPGKSGETIRSAFLLQAEVPIQTSISAFVIERSLDLIVVGVLATLLYGTPLLALCIFVVAVAFLSLLGIFIVKKFPPGTEQRLPKLLSRVLSIIRHAMLALRPKPLAGYVALGFFAWLSQGIGFFCIVALFTENIEIFKAIGIYCAGLFVGAVSMIPGGVGVTEGSLSWLLQNVGVDQNAAILSALISRGCTLWLAVAIGCVALAAIIKGQTIPLSSKILKEPEAL